ncbi:MAG: hypothetical protein R3E87_17460 [Burkholderiaceae bacterium]
MIAAIHRHPVRLLLASAAVVLVLLSIAGPVVASGLLAGWMFCLSIGLGAGLWLLIGTLTGGNWVESARPALDKLSRTTPAVAAFGLTLPAAMSALYPWAGDDARAGTYLSPGFFVARLPFLLLVIAALGLLAPRQRRPLAAALLLLVFAPVQTLAANDWLLSRDPAFGSTIFAAAVTICQLALAAATVCAMRLSPGRGAADWGGLLLAFIVGWAYFSAMQYLVLWTGNLPADAAWFAARPAWPVLTTALVGQLLPFLILLSSELRRRPRMLRIVGMAVLAGGWTQMLSWSSFGSASSVAFAGLVATLPVGLAAVLMREGIVGRSATDGGAR